MVKYNYQWSKTLRFGLNRKNDEKKYKSHQELGEFLKISEDKIITEVEKNNRNTIKETSDLLNFTECVLKDIEEYLEKVYHELAQELLDLFEKAKNNENLGKTTYRINKIASSLRDSFE